jgi:PadR family transcriptional regulator PadR
MPRADSPLEAAARDLPRNFLRSCVLLLLREEQAHGYDMLQRLRPLGFTGDDPGRLYRTLRALEHDGLVRSAWEASESGPDRRRYELTRKGLKELHATARTLDDTRKIIDAFVGRYEEFVALRSERAAARR